MPRIRKQALRNKTHSKLRLPSTYISLNLGFSLTVPCPTLFLWGIILRSRKLNRVYKSLHFRWSSLKFLSSICYIFNISLNFSLSNFDAIVLQKWPSMYEQKNSTSELVITCYIASKMACRHYRLRKDILLHPIKITNNPLKVVMFPGKKVLSQRPDSCLPLDEKVQIFSLHRIHWSKNISGEG